MQISISIVPGYGAVIAKGGFGHTRLRRAYTIRTIAQQLCSPYLNLYKESNLLDKGAAKKGGPSEDYYTDTIPTFCQDGLQHVSGGTFPHLEVEHEG
jgi:hypothetical protein